MQGLDKACPLMPCWPGVMKKNTSLAFHIHSVLGGRLVHQTLSPCLGENPRRRFTLFFLSVFFTLFFLSVFLLISKGVSYFTSGAAAGITLISSIVPQFCICLLLSNRGQRSYRGPRWKTCRAHKSGVAGGERAKLSGNCGDPEREKQTSS